MMIFALDTAAKAASIIFFYLAISAAGGFFGL